MPSAVSGQRAARRRLRRLVMYRYSCPAMADGLTDLYQDLLTGSYDCVDRIILNGYFRMAHRPAGFRTWWRKLTGSDDTLDNTHLMRMRSEERRVGKECRCRRWQCE